MSVLAKLQTDLHSELVKSLSLLKPEELQYVLLRVEGNNRKEAMEASGLTEHYMRVLNDNGIDLEDLVQISYLARTIMASIVLETASVEAAYKLIELMRFSERDSVQLKAAMEVLKQAGVNPDVTVVHELGDELKNLISQIGSPWTD